MRSEDLTLRASAQALFNTAPGRAGPFHRRRTGFDLENQSVGEDGGVYLFRDLASAEAYLAMHSARLKSFGIVDINANIFAVNEPLSRLNRWPE